MDEKTCVVTGATSGIGYAIAKGLARQGFTTILVGRDPARGQRALKEIEEATANKSLAYYNIDLSSQQQIRTTGAVIRQAHPIINVLVNNAAVWTSKLELTEDGVERQFAVNHLAYFLLTHILYSSLANSDDARVINIGSDSHKYGKLNFEDVNLSSSYHGLKAYGQSKLANLFFTYELDRIKKHPNISLYCVQPGLVKTDIGVKHTNPFHSLMWKLRRMGGVSAEEAASTAIFLATDPEARNKSGLYWDKCKPKESSKLSRNNEHASRLWKLSENMCGIQNYFD